MTFDGQTVLGPWPIYLASLVLILSAGAVGGWLGSRTRFRDDTTARAQIGTLESALFTLLALMVGFSFAMALTRFDARRDAVLQEANAIGTATLRTDFLSAPQADAAKALLRDYVRLRLDVAHASQPFDQMTAEIRRSNALQDQLWRLAAAASTANPRSVSVGQFVEALNAMIDLQETRLTADRNQVPAVVFLLLYAMAMVAMGYAGYGTALAGSRGRVPNLMMGALIATVIGLIVDIDYPRAGLVTVSQQPMLDLAASLGM